MTLSQPSYYAALVVFFKLRYHLDLGDLGTSYLVLVLSIAILVSYIVGPLALALVDMALLGFWLIRTQDRSKGIWSQSLKEDERNGGKRNGIGPVSVSIQNPERTIYSRSSVQKTSERG